jgi:hypothetical protein
LGWELHAKLNFLVKQTFVKQTFVKHDIPRQTSILAPIKPGMLAASYGF